MKLAFTATDSYVDYMGTTLLSIMRQMQERAVEVFLLTSGISAHSRDKLARLEALYPHLTVTVIEVAAEAFAGLPLNRSHITRPEVYFRMAFPTLLPDRVERVLYLDSDLLVQQDLQALWETDLTGYLMAGVSEPPSEGAFAYRQSIGMSDPRFYVNSGVLLMDLAQMRREQVQAHLFAVGDAIKDKILLQDQDIINVALEGRIKPLDVTYNYGYMERFAGLLPLDQVAILHFSLEKPWLTHLDVADYNREAVDAYLRLHRDYRRLVEPLITVLVRVTSLHQLSLVGKTLASLKEQTYGHRELVLVDETGDAAVAHGLWSLVKEEPACRYYGVQAGLAAGLSHALGRYVTVLQAGDQIDPSFLAVLYQSLRCSTGQASLTSPTFFNQKTGVYRFVSPLAPAGQVWSGADLLGLVDRQAADQQVYYLSLRGWLLETDRVKKALRLGASVREVLAVLGKIVQADPKLLVALEEESS